MAGNFSGILLSIQNLNLGALNIIDWLIVVAMIVLITVVALSTRKYVHGVADFLAAGRVAGRYMLTVAEGSAWFGAITVIAMFEMVYKSGFTSLWWTTLYTPAILMMSVFGWVIYRYRETRSLTLGQFFEMRYSKNFRLFAGILGWFSGIVNMGIFPAVGARFIMYYCFPQLNEMAQIWQDLAYAGIMAGLIGFSLFFIFGGGQISVMLTDFVQGIFCNIVFIVILAFLLLHKFDWGQILETLRNTGDKASFINPLKTSDLEDFNFWYFLIATFGIVYSFMAWQGSSGYNASARNPHEALMARILANWRAIGQAIVFVVMPVCAFVYMNNAHYTEQAAAVQAEVNKISDPYLQKQALPSIALRDIMKVVIGMSGAFVAVMIAASTSCMESYLHSWGSIFVQDVIKPSREKTNVIWTFYGFLVGACVLGFAVALYFSKFWLFNSGTLSVAEVEAGRHLLYKIGRAAPFIAITAGYLGWLIHYGLYSKESTKQHLRLLRASIGFVALFIFTFSFLYRQTQDIFLFFALTGAIFLGGAGSVIVGGLYWKKGTTGAAWSAMIVGAILSLIQVIIDQWWHPGDGFSIRDWLVAHRPGLIELWPALSHDKFPINGQWLYLIAMLAAIAVYVVISLLANREFNMEQLLHRGKYAVAEDQVEKKAALAVRGWRVILGITPDFTTGDKVISYATVIWSLFWVAIFLVGTTWGVIPESWGFPPLKDVLWEHFWGLKVGLMFVATVTITLWLGFGGLKDMKAMYRDLAKARVNTADDGSVHRPPTAPREDVAGAAEVPSGEEAGRK